MRRGGVRRGGDEERWVGVRRGGVRRGGSEERWG